MTVTPALTIRELRAILDEAPDPDALVFVGGGHDGRHLVLMDRYFFLRPGDAPQFGCALVIGSRAEDHADQREVA